MQDAQVKKSLPDIPEFHFFSWGLDVPRPDLVTNVTHISEILECLERHMSGSQAYRGSPHGPIEKEMSFEGREK